MMEKYVTYFAMGLIVLVLVFLVIFESLDNDSKTSNFWYVIVAFIMFAALLVVSIFGLTYDSREFKSVVRKLK